VSQNGDLVLRGWRRRGRNWRRAESLFRFHPAEI